MVDSLSETEALSFKAKIELHQAVTNLKSELSKLNKPRIIS
jgi:hypothetical protein